MKKIVFILMFLLMNNFIFAQLNPVKMLSYQQPYMYGCYFCPGFNCFSLSWNAPDASSDTLIGYKVYRNNIFWKFTHLTNLSCMGIAPCEYADIYDAIPFWFTVKAVYNYDSLLSVANDSVQVSQIALNIDDIGKNSFLALNNPLKKGDNIKLFIPYNDAEHCKLAIFSQNTRLIKTYELGKISGSILSISSDQLNIGLYIIHLQIANKILTAKLLIE